MANVPSITAADLDSRIKAFESLLSPTQGESQTAYVARVQHELAAIETQLPVDQANANAIFVKGWLGIGGSYHLGSEKGPVVANKVVETAKKEMLPADSMIRATLRGIVERQTTGGNRQLGRRPEQFQADIDAAKSRADKALVDLRAGKPGAADALVQALGQIRDTLKGASAEATSDDAAIASMRQGIEQFEPVTRDTGLFDGRKSEKAALATARTTNDALRAEPQAERALAGRGQEIVRPLVVGQLQSDPAFASRNYPAVTSQIGGWDEVGSAAGAARDQSHQFASAVSGYRNSLQTVANGPTTLAQLDAELGQARANLEAAVRDLQQAQQQHAATARSLSSSRIAAEAAAGLAAGAARNAAISASEWNDDVNAKADEVRRLNGRISDLEDRIRDLQSGGGNPTPGSSGNTRPGSGNPTPGGGNPTPGGGNPTPGGSSSGSTPPDNTAAINEARRQLQDTRSTRTQVVNQLSRSEAERDAAAEQSNRAAAASSAAAFAVNQIIDQQRQNDAFLADRQGRSDNANEQYQGAQNRRTQAAQDIDNAKRTIAAAPQAIPAQGEAYNKAVARAETVAAKAAIGDDGRKALQGVGTPTLPVSTLREAVGAGDQGVAVLGQAAQGVVQANDKRVELITQTRGRLQTQADQIVNTAVGEALR